MQFLYHLFFVCLFLGVSAMALYICSGKQSELMLPRALWLVIVAMGSVVVGSQVPVLVAMVFGMELVYPSMTVTSDLARIVFVYATCGIVGFLITAGFLATVITCHRLRQIDGKAKTSVPA